MPVPGGQFITTTQVWDSSAIYGMDVTKPEFKELLVRMYQQLNSMAMAVNGRDAGTYTTDEFVNGQSFFPTPGLTSASSRNPAERQVHRKVINFGALPNTATKMAAHGLAIKASSVGSYLGWTFTRIYGTASDTTNREFIPLPYSTGVLANNIELYVDATNVTVVTGADWSSYDTTYIVLEYLKQ